MYYVADVLYVLSCHFFANLFMYCVHFVALFSVLCKANLGCCEIVFCCNPYRSLFLRMWFCECRLRPFYSYNTYAFLYRILKGAGGLHQNSLEIDLTLVSDGGEWYLSAAACFWSHRKMLFRAEISPVKGQRSCVIELRKRFSIACSENRV